MLIKIQMNEKKGSQRQRHDHETSVLGDLNTIISGSVGEGPTSSARKRYSRSVLSLQAQEPSVVPSLYFTLSDKDDIYSHEDDLAVLSVITMARNMHRVLIDQGSSTDVMLWTTYLSLNIPSE